MVTGSGSDVVVARMAMSDRGLNRFVVDAYVLAEQTWYTILHLAVAHSVVPHALRDAGVSVTRQIVSPLRLCNPCFQC
jgi:hypothetical protein